MAKPSEPAVIVSTCTGADVLTVETYPEVVATSRPDLMAVSQHVRDQSRAKIPSQVDGIASLPAEASANPEDHEEQTEWCEVAGTEISVVLEGVDQEHQKPTGDELGEELSRLGHERCGVGAEDACCRGVASDRADARATLEDVDGGLVVAVDNGSCGHGTEDLGEHVDGELAPWELSVDAVGKCDRGVQVCS